MSMMKRSIFVTVLALVSSFTSSQIIVNNSQFNNTEFYEHINTTEINFIETKPPPPIWCPGNMKQLVMDSDYFFTCQPRPCLVTDVNQPNMSLVNNNTEVVNFNDTSRQICAGKRFSQTLKEQSCKYVRLSSQQFKLNYTDGSLYEFQTNSTYKLGEYFYYPDAGEAVLCRLKLLPKDVTEDVTIWCSIHQVNLNEAIVHPNNGSVYLKSINRVIRKGFYNIEQDNNLIDFCIPVTNDMWRCKILMDIFSKNFRLEPNMDLWTNDGMEIVYPVGEYHMEVTRSLALICVNAAEPRREETRNLYATAYIVSAIFSFLTLLVHLFFPNLNYHAKALLCHIISLLIMYITLTIRAFVSKYNSDFGRLFLFVLQYVSALATFFWVNVLAYELWRVFSNMNVITIVGFENGQRRWFIAKCFYAWGVPLALCILIIGLSYEPSTATYFDLPFASNVIWFNSDRNMFIFFYLPIIIILIENVIFFALTIWHIKKASRGADILNKKISRQLLRVCIKLFVVMGMFWFAEVISWRFHNKTDEAVWYVTDLINALQGVAIFLIYVCKRSTWRMLRKRWKAHKDSNSQSKSTSSTSGEKTRNNVITMTNIIRSAQNDQHQISSDQHQISSDQNQISSDQHQISSDQHQISRDQHQISSDQHKISRDQHQTRSDQHQISNDQHHISYNER